MSKYPAWWNTTITIFNRYENKLTQEVTWYRTTLKNCFWKTGLAVVYYNDSSFTGVTDSIICRIPKNSKFLSSYDWNNLVDKTRKFTLQPGDIVIKGVISDSINEYVKGSRSTDLMDKYKTAGMIKISAVLDNSDNTLELPHYFIK